MYLNPLAGSPMAQRALDCVTYGIRFAWDCYITVVRVCYSPFCGTRLDFIASVIVTMVTEPGSAIYAGQLMHASNKFSALALNPEKLSEAQQKIPPTVFFPGDFSTPDPFIPLIIELAARKPDNPLFTIQVHEGIFSETEHLPIMVAEVKRIVGRYRPGEFPGIALVGHSSGGNGLLALARLLAKDDIKVLALLKVGSTFKTIMEVEECSQICRNTREFPARYDVFEGQRSLLRNSPSFETCHLGLLFHKPVIDEAVNMLAAVN